MLKFERRIDERDADGDLTPMALALSAIADNGCDCGVGEEGSCLACLCESALRAESEKLLRIEEIYKTYLEDKSDLRCSAFTVLNQIGKVLENT
jgi:hypothetical protein